MLDPRVVHAHARIVDHRMHDAVRIGLRRPDIVVDGLGEGLAGCVQFEDRHHFARLRLLDQVVILKSPGRGDVRAEAAPGVAGVASRAGAHIQDSHFQHVAGFGTLDGDGAGQQMDAQPFTGAAHEGSLRRTRAAAGDRFVLARPVVDAFGPRVVRDHAVVVVGRVVSQGFDRGAVAGAQGQRRRHGLAEIAPVDRGGRDGS